MKVVGEQLRRRRPPSNDIVNNGICLSGAIPAVLIILLANVIFVSDRLPPFNWLARGPAQSSCKIQ